MQPSPPRFVPTPEDAAFSRLIAYAAYQWPGYQDAAHHRLIARTLEDVERGRIKRLMIQMPPRHGKSMLASEFFPAWYLGRNPSHYVIAATYAQDLADDFGRKVRNQIVDPSFRAVFPGVTVKDDSSAVKRFHVSAPMDAFSTGQDGAYFAVGVGGPLTGRGAHLLLIDDPVKNREEADSEVIRKRARDWYTSTAYTRLMPGGSIVVIQCLAGDTEIDMADGSKKPILEIKPKDRVKSWNGKEFVSAEVSAVIDNGPDQTYLIRTKRTSVRANARHPFLVHSKGGLRWVRTSDLRPGMLMLRSREAPIKERLASSTDVKGRQSAEECAPHITTKRNGRPALNRLLLTLRQGLRTAASGVTALIKQSSTSFLPIKAAFVRFVSPTAPMEGRAIGLQTSCPIITTRQGRFAACYATTAIGSREELEIPPSWNALSSMSKLDTDEIVSVDKHAIEHVYDLSVEVTQNFVANGLLSHNTRWHEDDLSGWLMREHAHEGWHVLRLPAINTDGQPLWSEFYDLEALERIRRALPVRDWSALYQQEPIPDTGDYFKADWFRARERMPDRDTMRIYGASDYAVTADGGDYTVHGVIGVDPDGALWLLDMWRKQASSDEWVDAFCDLVRKWRPLEWAEETGQIKAGVGPFLERRMRERQAYVTRTQFPTRGDKAVRAQSIRGRMALDGLNIVASSPWRSDVMAECLQFPAGVHDDIVDMLGLAGQLLDRMNAGQRKNPTALKAQPSGYSVRSRGTGADWMTI